MHNETLLEARLYIDESTRLGLHDFTITTDDEVVSKNQLPVFIITATNSASNAKTPINNLCDSLGDMITISCQNLVLGDKYIGPKGYITSSEEIAGHVTSEGYWS